MDSLGSYVMSGNGKWERLQLGVGGWGTALHEGAGEMKVEYEVERLMQNMRTDIKTDQLTNTNRV